MATMEDDDESHFYGSDDESQFYEAMKLKDDLRREAEPLRREPMKLEQKDRERMLEKIMEIKEESIRRRHENEETIAIHEDDETTSVTIRRRHAETLVDVTEDEAESVSERPL